MMNGCPDWRCGSWRCLRYWRGLSWRSHTRGANTARAQSHQHTHTDAPPGWLALQEMASAVWLGCWPKLEGRRPSALTVKSGDTGRNNHHLVAPHTNKQIHRIRRTAVPNKVTSWNYRFGLLIADPMVCQVAAGSRRNTLTRSGPISATLEKSIMNRCPVSAEGNICFENGTYPASLLKIQNLEYDRPQF